MSEEEEGKLVPISLLITPRVDRLLTQLGRRRYGDVPDARNKVIQDAFKWLVDKLESKYELDWGEWFWLKLTRVPIDYVKMLAYGQLMMPYFDGMVEDE
jgi:hypothetical protein